MNKWIGISLIAVMLSVPLAACSKKESGSAETDPSKHDPVKLVVQNAMNSDDEARFMQGYGNAIQAKYPYISFEYSPSAQLKARVTSGADIDIVVTSSGLTSSQLIDNGLQSDITNLISKYKYDLSVLEPTTIQLQRNFSDGAIYGLPVNTVNMALFYNKDIFDKFGVEYPKDGMTWDDVYDLTKKVSRTDGSDKYLGFGMSVVHMMRLNQMSLSYLDPKSNKVMFADDNFKKLVENFSRFSQISGNQDNDFANLDSVINKFVKDKKLAMLVALSATVLETKNADAMKAMNWDMVDVPSFKESKGLSTQTYPVFFYIASTSKHRDDAFQAISYLTSEEFQLQQSRKGIISILNNNKKVMDAFGQDAPQLNGKNKKALSPAKYASPSPFNKYNSVAEGGLLNAFASIAQNKADINTALNQAVDTADKAVKAATSK